MSARDVIFPPGRQALYEHNSYSPAIRSNGFLFVSGQVGSRPDGSPEVQQPGAHPLGRGRRCRGPGGSPEADLEAQVRRAFDNLNAILEAAGCSFKDVVDVTVFIVDPISTFERIWSVFGEHWGEAPYPTLTGVGVT